MRPSDETNTLSGFKIAMHDFFGVRRCENIENVVYPGQELVHFDGCSVGAHRERFSFEQLHHQKRRAVFGNVAIEHLHDPRMLDAVGRAPLDPKALADVFAVAELAVQNFPPPRATR